MKRPLRLWGSTLSPFSMKARLCLELARLPHRWLPEEGRRAEVIALSARLLALRARPRGLRLPRDFDPRRDELPLVPFLVFADGAVGYDSTAIGEWVAEQPGGRGLVPEDPGAALLCAVIDEAFDELGIYVMHHHRWVFSARTNRAGHCLADEVRLVMGPLADAFGRSFARRQVARLPYLFSVAEPGPPNPALPADRQPPAPPGFPPTHDLLDEIMRRQLDALEHCLSRRPYLLGTHPTLADASVYGQLVSHTLMDPEADALMSKRAPSVRAWVLRLRDHPPRLADVVDAPLTAAEALDGGALDPLLTLLGETALPLLAQNAAAYERVSGDGEAGFDAGTSLYDGELMGVPFRAGAKRFQQKVWERLRRRYRALNDDARDLMATRAPMLEQLG